MIYDHNTNQLLVLRKQDKIKDQILYVCSSYLLFRYPRHTKTSNIIDLWSNIVVRELHANNATKSVLPAIV